MAPEAILAVERKDSNHVVLTGDVNAHHIRATLRRFDREFRLRKPDFEWIKTVPEPFEADQDH